MSAEDYRNFAITLAERFGAIIVAVIMSLVVGVLVYVLLMRKMTGEMVLAARCLDGGALDVLAGGRGTVDLGVLVAATRLAAERTGAAHVALASGSEQHDGEQHDQDGDEAEPDRKSVV